MMMGRASPKYHNIPKRVDGILFQSTKEARRYTELKSMQQAGVIQDLKTQVWYDLNVNGVHITKYVADFVYYDNERKQEVVEDPKGMRTQLYVIKNRLMKAVHGIEIEEP
jgi:hypothetical protein